MNERIEKLRYMQVIGWEFRAVLEQAKIERPLEGLRHCEKLPRPRERREKHPRQIARRPLGSRPRDRGLLEPLPRHPRYLDLWDQ